MNATTETTSSFSSEWSTPATGEVIEAEDDVDSLFIAALVLFSLGAILLIVAMIKLALWLRTNRKRKRYKKWWLRQLEVKRHLSEYSIRTADDYSEIGKPRPVVNLGFREDEISHKSSPQSSPEPGSSTSADVHNSAEESIMNQEDERIIESENGVMKSIHIL